MKAALSDNKLRGGYYTPELIATFLAEWSITKSTGTVLEPSCGDGNILCAVAERLKKSNSAAKVIGIELTEREAQKAKERLKNAGATNSFSVLTGDFFDHAARLLEQESEFDVVIGNPPFVRYQDFPEDQRQKAFGIMRSMGLNPSRLTNLWMPFLAISAKLLSARGKLAMVIPAELFQVGYASELRQFLATHFPLINIVTFRKLVFPDIQQEIVLILAEKSVGSSTGIRVHEVDDAKNLSKVDLKELAKKDVKPIDHASEKWTKYFLDRDEILLLRELRERIDIPQLRKFIDIDVGVVTGDNDYFLLSQEEVAKHKIAASTIPIVGRSAALTGIRFSEHDFTEWERLGKKAHMFLPLTAQNSAVKRYIRSGVEAGVNEGYKCRIRKEWYVVPSVWTPDIFFLRQADQSPRMVANGTRAICTDTLHRGKLVDGFPAAQLAAAFTNSLTFAASEVTGRSYGGGVMTFEPSEVEKLPLPVVGIDQLDVDEIDTLIRSKRTLDALDVVDRALLVGGLGLRVKDVRTLRGIWSKLKDRRKGRK